MRLSSNLSLRGSSLYLRTGTVGMPPLPGPGCAPARFREVGWVVSTWLLRMLWNRGDVYLSARTAV